MIRRLSYSIRTSPIWEGKEDFIVDFEIDGESIWQRMKRLEPVWMTNPRGNPDGKFVGMCVGSVRFKESLYRTGSHPWYRGLWRGLLPLLACSDCGESGCGGVWTRIYVGRRRVFWSGLGFSGGGFGFGPVYDRTVFVFDREQYDATLDELLRQIDEVAPVVKADGDE